MTPFHGRWINRIQKFFCMLLISTCAVQAAAPLKWPGIRLDGISLGMDEGAFTRRYPDATSEPGRGSTQYWLKRGPLYLAEFRSGKLALLKASYGKMTSDEQRRLTSSFVQEMSGLFGQPHVVKTAKLIREGVAETQALVFDAESGQANAKIVLESTQLELEVTIIETTLLRLDSIFFSVDKVTAELSKNANQPRKSLVPGAFVDFVGEIVSKGEATSGTKAPGNHTASGVQGATALPTKSSSTPGGIHHQTTKKHEAISRNWMVWLTIVLVAPVAAAWMFLRKSK